MSNVSNLLNLATLANSLQGLKGQASGTDFYTDFAKGLVSASSSETVSKGVETVKNAGEI